MVLGSEQFWRAGHWQRVFAERPGGRELGGRWVGGDGVLNLRACAVPIFGTLWNGVLSAAHYPQASPPRPLPRDSSTPAPRIAVAVCGAGGTTATASWASESLLLGF